MVVDKNNSLPLFSLWFLSCSAMKGGWMTSNVTMDLHKNVAVITSELKLGSSKCFPFWGTIIALRLGRKLYHHYCFKGASVIRKQHIRACPHRKEIISNQQCYNPIGCCSLFMAWQSAEKCFRTFVCGKRILEEPWLLFASLLIFYKHFSFSSIKCQKKKTNLISLQDPSIERMFFKLVLSLPWKHHQFTQVNWPGTLCPFIHI